MTTVLRHHGLSWAMITAGVLLVGCGTGGQLGDQGHVRFSQIVNFAEAPDFHAPVVVNSTLFVGLEHPSGGTLLTDPPVYVELEVRASPVGHGGTAQVFPLGFAQYGLMFRDAGDYRVEALEDGMVVDTISVHAAPARRLRLSTRIDAHATGQGANGSCSQSIEIANLEGATLHSNDTVSVYLVPEDGSGTPMLGLLGLTASGTPGVALTSQLLSRFGLANELDLSAASGSASGAQSVTVRDSVTGASTDVHFTLDGSARAVTCR